MDRSYEHHLYEPEGGQQTESRFNVTFGLLDDDDVIELNRAILAASDAGRQREDGELQERHDRLQEALVDALREHATVEPDQVQRVVHQCALNRNPLDRWLAVGVASSLIDHNFEFTKRVLVHLCVDELTEDSEYGALLEQAQSVISELMNNRLTPEQIAEFKDLLAFYRPITDSRP